MNASEFETKLEEIIQQLHKLQVRHLELVEFENQWSKLFSDLKVKTGRDFQITISNYDVYKAFHWDKYQVLATELYSVLENESTKGFSESFLKQVNKHFYLELVDSYVNHYSNVYHVFPQLPGTDIEKHNIGKRLEAKKIYDTKVQALLKLFPNIDKSSYNIKQNDIDKLVLNIVTLKSELKSIRDFFSHRYEETVAPKYVDSIENLKAEHFETAINQLFEIIKNVILLYKNSTLEKFIYKPEQHISDQIDLILFGSIEKCILLFYKDQPKELPYAVARNKFYESDKILSIEYEDEY